MALAIPAGIVIGLAAIIWYVVKKCGDIGGLGG